MRLSVDIPDTWSEPLKTLAHSKGARSVSDYLLSLISIELNKPKPTKPWGGKREQVTQDAQDTQLEQDDELAPPEARPGPRVLSSAEILAQRKAEAAKKFQRSK